jgi:DNA-binding protein H-NS
MATSQELLAQKEALEKQRADLEKQIAAAKRTERAGVINQIRTLMDSHGITLEDLGGKPAKATRTKAGGAKSSTMAGRKVAPKYRNKATGDTWSGRGLQPKWLKAALAAGHKIEEFAV